MLFSSHMFYLCILSILHWLHTLYLKLTLIKIKCQSTCLKPRRQLQPKPTRKDPNRKVDIYLQLYHWVWIQVCVYQCFPESYYNMCKSFKFYSCLYYYNIYRGNKPSVIINQVFRMTHKQKQQQNLLSVLFHR